MTLTISSSQSVSCVDVCVGVCNGVCDGVCDGVCVGVCAGVCVGVCDGVVLDGRGRFIWNCDSSIGSSVVAPPGRDIAPSMLLKRARKRYVIQFIY